MARPPFLDEGEIWLLLMVVALGLFVVGWTERAPQVTGAGLLLGSVGLVWAKLSFDQEGR